MNNHYDDGFSSISCVANKSTDKDDHFHRVHFSVKSFNAEANLRKDDPLTTVRGKYRIN